MKILVLCLPGIGDALMATPMVKVLRKEFPKAQIDVLCMFDGVRYVYQNNPYVDNVYHVSLFMKGKINALKKLWRFRKEGYDVSILCFPGYRREYHWVQYFIGAKKRISHKFNHGYLEEFNFLDTDLVLFEDEEHHVTNNLNLLKPLGIDWSKKYKRTDFKYDLILDKADIEFGKSYIKELGWDKDDVIGIHPGSINSKLGLMKRWPVKNFADLAKLLIKKKKKILIFIGPDEIEVGVKLYKLINDKKNCVLINNLKFNQSVGVLSQISLLISNDNGFAHLSNGLGIKSVILFGPTNMNWCSPYDKTICIIVRKAKFEPWFRNDIKVDDPPAGAKSGMEAIKVSDIVPLIH